MKKEELFRAIGEADEDMIADSQDIQKFQHKKRIWRNWKVWGTAVACLCFLVFALSIPNIKMTQMPDTDKRSQTNSTDKLVPETQGEAKSDSETELDKELAEDKNDGVTIPSIELPEETESVSMDMIGLIVYKGNVYTQAETFWKKEVEKIEPLLGEYLGSAKGTINEWSKQEEYATEFASTYYGDVYAVNGYDTDFRLLLVEEYEEDNGTTSKSAVMLEHLNGITLKTGTDLFEERLNISGNIDSVRYVSHSDWDLGNVGEKYYREMNCSDEQFEQFYDELLYSNFEFVYDSNPEIYDVKPQAHVYIRLKDGLTTEIRLIDGGYVGYQSFGVGGYCFVKMPGEAFDAILNACQ